MKKFCTKQFVYGLIFGATLLSAACRQPVSPTDGPGTSTPPGTGKVRVTFADGAARTVYPGKVFDHYVYTFTKVGASAGEVKTPDANGVFTLETGNWNLAVQAYATASNDSPAATGNTAAAFTVSQNSLTDNITVILSPAASTGAGTVNYTLKYPDASTLQTLTFVQVGGGLSVDVQTGATTSSADGVTTLAGTKTGVSAGYYLVTAILKDGAARIAGKSEVVHIYNNLTTAVDWNFADDDFTAPGFNAAAPVITSPPVGASYNHYEPATLAVSASVNDGGNLTFQWYSNGTNSNSGGAAISGETGASYTSATATVGTVYYYVVVTNTNSNVNGNTTATTTSDAVVVTVDNIIGITEANPDQMKSFIAAAASAGGGTSKTDPIVVKVTIANASLLSGYNGGGADPLHKLFDAIPSGKYVAYDLSGCTFTSIGDIDYGTFNARTTKAYLASIALPDTLLSIGEKAFRDCTSLTSVTIGSSVTSIGNSAFSGCSGLTSVTIPDSVTSIDGSAFAHCSGLTSITIPDSVTSIESYAFQVCSSLTSVYVLRDTAPLTILGMNAFYNTPVSLIIYVPSGIVDDYKGMTNWSTYASKIQAGSPPTP